MMNFDDGIEGTDKRVLFVCSAGMLRSATAARIYARKYNTRCCGSKNYALIPLTLELIDWADEVVFVNEENYQDAQIKFDFLSMTTIPNIKILNIEDIYNHMHPKLIKEFKEQYEDF